MAQGKTGAVMRDMNFHPVSDQEIRDSVREQRTVGEHRNPALIAPPVPELRNQKPECFVVNKRLSAPKVNQTVRFKIKTGFINHRKESVDFVL